MRPSIRLGRLFGIDIGLHYSWFIIALLIFLSLVGHFEIVNPQWNPALTWTLAAITAVLFFASIVAHELSHAAVANARGMPVKSITLFALGGVASLEKEPVDAKSEFSMAIVGPVTSAVVGLFFLAVAWIAGWRPAAGTPPSPLWAGLVWLGYINIALAVFNMIPGYPLDGGRVLRSIIWAINRDLVRATKIAAVVGQFVAVAFIVFGFYRFFSGAGFGGLWLAFIGWFLADAAVASYAGVEASVTLAHVRVSDVMSDDCPVIDGNLNLSTLAEDYLLRTGRRCFIVLQNGRHQGLVTINELKQVERNRWPFTTVAQIARPLEKVRTVSPDTPLSRALELMAAADVNQLPVMSNGQLMGVISRSDVLQFLQTRAELKAA
ncbi:MAG TPA: site-2 protease family protein [Terriglobia bacterium]|nr:site-2 protease family protein [Terriglobia bacterium]